LLAYTKFTFKEFRVCVRAIFAFAGVPPRHTRAAFPAGGAEHAGAGASPHQEARTFGPIPEPDGPGALRDRRLGSIRTGPLRDFNSDEGFKVALDQSIDAATAESGRANLGAVGNHLLKLLPDCDG
jgi:hypothetical protein